MRIILFVLSLLTFVGSLAVTAAGAMGSIYSAVGMLTAAVLFSAACIVDALVVIRQTIEQRLQAMADDTMKIRYQVEKLTRE